MREKQWGGGNDGKKHITYDKPGTTVSTFSSMVPRDLPNAVTISRSCSYQGRFSTSSFLFLDIFSTFLTLSYL